MTWRDAMLVLLVSAAAVLQSPPAPVTPSPACRDLTPAPAAGQPPPGARKLGELPPGRMFHTVLRSWGGCDLAEVRRIGPDGQAAWVWEPSGAGRLERALPARRTAPPDDR